jgi:hypothetical protein
MRIVRYVCLLALLAGASLHPLHPLDRANAQASQEVQQACTPDAMRLCSEFIPDVPKITACMKAKHAQVSETCRIAMLGGRHGLRHTVRYRRREHCDHHRCR